MTDVGNRPPESNIAISESDGDGDTAHEILRRRQLSDSSESDDNIPLAELQRRHGQRRDHLNDNDDNVSDQSNEQSMEVD